MIIDPASELGNKDIEAQRGASSSQSQLTSPSTSTSTSAVPIQQYLYEHSTGEIECDSMLPGSFNVPVNTFFDSGSPDPHEPLGPPPAFTPYEAEWSEVGHGDVVSHDEHLNTDGEALYRFLLTQASQRPPGYRFHCRGTHTETRYRFVTSHSHHHHHDHHHGGHHHSGGTSTHTESYRERVTDFDFYIDVTPPFPSPLTTPPPAPLIDSKSRTGQSPNEDNSTPRDDFAPIHWSVADNEPVYRGKMVREVGIPYPTSGISLPETDLPHLSSTHTRTQLRNATRREQKDYADWIRERTSNGLPPWATPSVSTSWNPVGTFPFYGGTSPTTTLLPTSREILKSSKSMREWADEYCASPKLLKEFVYSKQLYGWNISDLRAAIRSTIALAPYQGDIEVDVIPINSKIYIRPSNRLSRAFSNAWLKFISIILLIFPFIWLFKRFHKKGGGRWQVCGGAYALKRMVPVQSNGHTTTSQGSVTGSSGSSGSNNGLPSYEDVAGPSTLGSSYASPRTPTSSLLPSFPVPSTSTTTSSPQHTNHHTRIIQTPQGPHKLIGQREGEWFRNWEPIILRSVLTRYQSSVPLTSHGELYGRYTAPGSALEGYHDNEPTGSGLPPTQPNAGNLGVGPAGGLVRY